MNIKKETAKEKTVQSSSLKQVRKWCLLALVVIFSSLFIYGKLFNPKPPKQESLIPSLKEDSLFKGLEWYTRNSQGSLFLPLNEICTVSEEKKVEHCSIFNTSIEIPALIETLGTVLSDTSLWPSLWHPDASYSDSSVSFSLFTIQPVTIHALRNEPRPLGDEIEVLISFRRTGLSPILTSMITNNPDLFQSSKLEEMESMLDQEYQHSIRLKKHTMGYYLPVPPLPGFMDTKNME
jgi:hypothetical protein